FGGGSTGPRRPLPSTPSGRTRPRYRLPEANQQCFAQPPHPPTRNSERQLWTPRTSTPPSASAYSISNGSSGEGHPAAAGGKGSRLKAKNLRCPTLSHAAPRAAKIRTCIALGLRG